MENERDHKIDSYIESQKIRSKALEWWSNLPNNYTGNSKGGLAFKHGFDNRQSHSNLTSSEIESIWLKETTDLEEIAESMYKQNQKQFKEFNPELFKAYIEKFSEEDKKKALQILCTELDMMLSY